MVVNFFLPWFNIHKSESLLISMNLLIYLNPDYIEYRLQYSAFLQVFILLFLTKSFG